MKDSWDIEETSSNNGIKGEFHFKDKSSVINAKDNYVIKPEGFGVRHFQTLLMFMLLVVSYLMRINMSVAIVHMVDNSGNPDIKHYNWNVMSQITVLSSFFLGYILAQIPAGVISRIYGPKIPLMGAVLLCAVLSLVTPAAAAGGSWPLIVGFRIVQGLTQSFIFPGTHTLLSKWAPSDERGRLTTYAYAGTQAGIILTLFVCPLLATSTMGWPSIFYFSGAAAIAWVILYFIFGCNSPAECNSISSLEREYIEASLGTGNEDSNKMNTPWKKIFTSVPFIALIIAHCAQNWGFWSLILDMPAYMLNVLNLNINENVLLSASPYILIWISSFVFCIIGDKMIKNGHTSITASRKIFNSIGLYGPMLILIGLGYVNKENTILAVSLLAIAIGINSATSVGFMVNHMDLSLNFAGTLMGITNFFGNVTSIFLPLLVKAVVHGDRNDLLYWRAMFFISSGMYFIGNTVFVLFGSGEKQSWNKPTN